MAVTADLHFAHAASQQARKKKAVARTQGKAKQSAVHAGRLCKIT